MKPSQQFTQKQQVRDLLKAIETGEAAAVAVINPTKLRILDLTVLEKEHMIVVQCSALSKTFERHRAEFERCLKSYAATRK